MRAGPARRPIFTRRVALSPDRRVDRPRGRFARGFRPRTADGVRLPESFRDRRPVPVKMMLWTLLAAATVLLITNHKQAGPLVVLATVAINSVTTWHYRGRNRR